MIPPGMKVTGFTFIKNAVKYDYPVVEAIRSILPICDDFVVALGQSDDDTEALIQAIDTSKIKIVRTVWDESLREGGRVLAAETNKALAAIPEDSDWAFYIQGDEVVHEQYLPLIQAAMQAMLHEKNIDGLLFHYLHFYGSYDYVGASKRWYEHEIRVIRNRQDIYSYRDAQGFRKGDNQKLNVAAIDAYVYHYGWVKDPRAMQAKQENFQRYWHNDQWIEQHVPKVEQYDFSNIDSLAAFKGTHPAVMQARVERVNWQFDYDLSFNRLSLKQRLKAFLKRYLGIDTSYKNYILKKSYTFTPLNNTKNIQDGRN
jgi:hypothetical protein